MIFELSENQCVEQGDPLLEIVTLFRQKPNAALEKLLAVVPRLSAANLASADAIYATTSNRERHQYIVARALAEASPSSPVYFWSAAKAPEAEAPGCSRDKEAETHNSFDR